MAMNDSSTATTPASSCVPDRAHCACWCHTHTRSQPQLCLPGWSVAGAAAVLVGATRLTLANALITLESSG
jgi:hypothetical protein